MIKTYTGEPMAPDHQLGGIYAIMDRHGMLPDDWPCLRCARPLNADGGHPAELCVEEWRPAVGHEGVVEVSRPGNVRTVDRVVTYPSNGRRCRYRGRPLPVQWDSDGYPRVQWTFEGTHYVCRVHLLVARAFLGKCPEGQETRHGPVGIKVPAAWNLSYGTPGENTQDKWRDGTMPWGEQSGKAKLTVAIVAQCRQRRAAGEAVAALAREFRVSAAAMSQAVNGRTWRGAA